MPDFTIDSHPVRAFLSHPFNAEVSPILPSKREGQSEGALFSFFAAPSSGMNVSEQYTVKSVRLQKQPVDGRS